MRRRLHFALAAIHARMGASSFLVWRTDGLPFCRQRPFSRDLALPSGVRGPVLYCDGRFANADWRSRSLPSGVSSPRSALFRFPAATRAGDLLVVDGLATAGSSIRCQVFRVTGAGGLDGLLITWA